jgi:hypothetical protein
MESENIVLGKINKKKVYLNGGKYGHYLKPRITRSLSGSQLTNLIFILQKD